MKPAWLSKQPITWLYRLILFLAWLLFKVFYRHRVYGHEHFYAGPAIIAGNHTSYLDPPILAISWPQGVHFLAKEELFRNPLFGGFIRRLNAHPVTGEASDIGVFKTICGLLNEGDKIILFPEGKRNEINELAELKAGVAMLVARSKSAVVPAYIHGAFNIWNPSRKFPKLFGKTACVFGTPIFWSDFEHLDKKEAQKALLAKLSESINELRAWFEAGAKGVPP